MTGDERDGLTAREALDHIEAEFPETKPIESSDIELWKGGTTWVDAEYDERFGRFGESLLINALIDGTWYATGFRVPAELRKQIPVNFWSFLVVDYQTNTASGGGHEFVGLEFFEGEPDHPVSMDLAGKKCRLWLTEKFKAPKSEKKLDCQDVAMDQFKGLSNRGFLRAWTEAMSESTTHTSWNKPGPINSS